MSFSEKFKSIRSYIQQGIWYESTNDVPPLKKFGINLLKIILITVREFNKNRCMPRASALTYYSLLAVVPCLACLFGIAKGFGMDAFLESQIIQLLNGHEEMLEKVMTWVHALLNKTKGGLIAGIGLGTLLWSVMKLLTQIENAMNDIWYIEKSRTLLRKFTDYLSIVLVVPILLIVVFSLNIFASSTIDQYINNLHLQTVAHYLLGLFPYVLLWIVFILVYLIMPNGRINPKGAIIGGIVAGTAFEILIYYYFHVQMSISSFNVIYGSFAALPLFFVWMQLSWIIVLFGAELTYAVAKYDFYVFEKDTLNISDRRKKTLALVIMHTIVCGFDKNQELYSVTELSKKLDIPRGLTEKIVNILKNNQLLNKVVLSKKQDFVYQPAMDISKIYVSDILKAIDLDFEKMEKELFSNPTSSYFIQLLDQIGKEVKQSENNRLLKDIAI